MLSLPSVFLSVVQGPLEVPQDLSGIYKIKSSCQPLLKNNTSIKQLAEVAVMGERRVLLGPE